MRSGGRAGPDQFTDIRPDRSCSARVGPLLLPQHALGPAPAWPRYPPLAGTRGLGLSSHRPGGARQQPLINHDFAGYNFDRLDGLTYEIDVSMPAQPMHGASVFRHARAHPQPVPRRRHASRSRRGCSRGHQFLPGIGRRQLPVCADADRRIGNDLVRDTIVAFIKASKAPITRCPAHLQLARLWQGPLIFETGPGALRHESILRAWACRPSACRTTAFSDSPTAPGRASLIFARQLGVLHNI
jgi:2',3'-cyclic-nucleotide 2'-phosphodiesterase/3'-nucleotidase